jgi:hypothetical protein
MDAGDVGLEGRDAVAIEACYRCLRGPG